MQLPKAKVFNKEYRTFLKRVIQIAAALLLLLTLSVGSFFYYAYVNFSQVAAKAQAHYALAGKNTARLETIKIAAKDFNKGKDEIWHKGRLYDVAAYRTVQDSVLVSVYHDENEEVIVALIADHFSSNGNSSVNVNDPHISSRHHYSPNDVKSMCERITFSPNAFSAAGKAIASSRFIAYDLQTAFAIEIPPPRA